jgi:sulfate permease, SulP family
VRHPDATNWLPSNAVTIVDVYGSLFFAEACTLTELLPSSQDASRPVVVLRVYGRTQAGATLIDTLDEYADDLAETGGQLYPIGVDEDLSAQLRRTRNCTCTC